MKNKESVKRPLSSKNGSVRGSEKNKNEFENREKNIFNKESLLRSEQTKQRSNNQPTKSQINRLKNFYCTTRWLPNSAFTTYFGKPAFENYGYGNTKPVYGGLFYGNYMLTHNINPIDGENKPDTKQVYSSAMLKTMKNNNVRKPEPPRKTPDEIRNTPEELEEIRARKPIFQQENAFPERYIAKPNLVKARVFRSGKNTPVETENEECGVKEIYDGTFNIEDVLEGRTRRKSKGKNVNITFENANFNPFNPNSQKKKTKDKQNISTSKSNPNINKENKNVSNINRSQQDITNEMDGDFNEDEYRKQVEFYEKILRDRENNSNLAENDQNFRDIYIPNDRNINAERNNNEKDINEHQHNEKCSLCDNNSFNESRRLKKKENPCLVEPNIIKHTHVCCTHQPNKKLILEELDPRNYKYLPSCTLERIIPAGKPSKQSDPMSSIFK